MTGKDSATEYRPSSVTGSDEALEGFPPGSESDESVVNALDIWMEYLHGTK
jgi:hypothetical protein